MALFDKLKNLFRRKEVARPLSTKGHRGHAFRSLADPDLSAENQAKWKKLGGESVEAFVKDAQPMFVHSSNVALAQYFADSHKMMIEFLNGAAYMYYPISESWAYSFAEADSKGGWCWSYLRVRGPGGDHLPAPGITVTRIK
jgi:hypothetical protein